MFETAIKIINAKGLILFRQMNVYFNKTLEKIYDSEWLIKESLKDCKNSEAVTGNSYSVKFNYRVS